MKIADILKTKKPVYSFEFFPPKTPEGEESLYKTVTELKKLEPDYVSVTYGAMGNTRGKTFEIVEKIQKEHGITGMAHLTCVASSQDQIKDILIELKKRGIENIMALRGDAAIGETEFKRPVDGFASALELVTFIKKTDPNFCLGNACYPEGHIQFKNESAEIDYLKKKVDAGADFLVTQMFFENAYYFRYLEKIRAAGINLPVIPGIMPITNFKQIKRFTEMCAVEIPRLMVLKLEQANECDTEDIGIERAIEQCRELIQNGAPGIHFYTLNKSKATQDILIALRYNESK